MNFKVQQMHMWDALEELCLFIKIIIKLFMI